MITIEVDHSTARLIIVGMRLQIKLLHQKSEEAFALRLKIIEIEKMMVEKPVPIVYGSEKG